MSEGAAEKITKILRASSYDDVSGTERSPFWVKQFSGERTEKWFFNQKTSTSNSYEQIVLLRIPEDVVGHKGIAHGGFLAMLLDEALCFCAYPVLPHHTGVTASLNIDYKAPTPAGNWILIRAIATSEPGSRKASVSAAVYPLTDGESGLPWDLDTAKPSVIASQVVVEPKWHSQLTHR